MRSKLQIIYEIEDTLDHCRNVCTRSREIAKEVGWGRVACCMRQVCLNDCEVGEKLQQLGRLLNSGRKVKTPDWWDPGQDIMAVDQIITEESG